LQSQVRACRRLFTIHVHSQSSFSFEGGLGGLGLFISRAFAARKDFSTRILLRKGGSAKADDLAELKARGVTTVEVDYENVDSLVSGLKGVDAVISAVARTHVVSGCYLCDCIQTLCAFNSWAFSSS